MFSNNLIRSFCKSSDEKRLKLSENDWKIVLNANKDFTESEAGFRGNKLWGKYLLSKIKGFENEMEFSSSLELSCGNGFLYFSFNKWFDLKNNSYFLDLSVTQCAQFLKRSRNEGIGIPAILCGDIGYLPFKNSSLKLIYGNSFLHHLPDVSEYLREVYRVLSQEGKFIVFHEPSPTSTFWESFPISLYKNTMTNSLTDIWLISPAVIINLLLDAGFKKVEIIPNNLISSFFVTPMQIILNKLSLPYNSNFIVRMKMTCDKLETFLPRSFRLKYAPSLAIYSEK